ncbi:hypothetical protein ACFXB3_40255 [Streptomyces sp. NPDC059447]|uniref:hypothetical protein n=1 Tax=Streptomyces sp. NPDC059447 TaxID=3346834 RepID=UPI0036B64370
MDVFVNRVGEEQRVVAFRCEAGHGVAVARWMGDELPQQGTRAFVELTVAEPVSDWRPAEPAAGRALAVEPDGIAVTGEVLAIGGPEDPVVDLRVGTDVVLVEIGCRKDELRVGRHISFVTRTLEAYPYSL